uniref:Pyrroline-5-carboxylate reductase n=1 Tax=Culicoides sonorensis TaxID=179676 RepID=A0A336K9D3_CULSO
MTIEFKDRLSNAKIGFIGGGNMAFAIAKGLNDFHVIDQITAVSGPHLDKLQEKWSSIAKTTTTANWEVVQQCNVIFICVKPHMLTSMVDELKTHFQKFVIQDKLFVSVLAGTSKSKIYDDFGISPPQLRLVRMMPNTPVQVGEGVCAIELNTPTEDQNCDAEFINYLMGHLGTSDIVPPTQFNAVSALSGSGPAYIFTIIDALADGAVKQGIPRALAIKFASQTVCGAAKTQLVTGKHPGVLKDEVCSPGGTTICAIHELEKGGLRSTLINAIEAATKRAEELVPKK